MVAPTLLPSAVATSRRADRANASTGGEGAPQVRKGDGVIPPPRQGRVVGRHTATALDAANAAAACSALGSLHQLQVKRVGRCRRDQLVKASKILQVMKIEPRIRSMNRVPVKSGGSPPQRLVVSLVSGCSFSGAFASSNWVAGVGEAADDSPAGLARGDRYDFPLDPLCRTLRQTVSHRRHDRHPAAVHPHHALAVREPSESGSRKRGDSQMRRVCVEQKKERDGGRASATAPPDSASGQQPEAAAPGALQRHGTGARKRWKGEPARLSRGRLE